MLALDLGLSLGSSRPALSGAAPEVPPTLNELPFDGFVFDAADSAIASVTLSGTATPESALLVRGAGTGGATDWVAVTADAAGEWSATFDVAQPLWTDWFVPEARYAAGGPVAQGSNTFGCGTVLGFMGQSELTYFHALGESYNPLPYPALLASNLTVVLQDDGTGQITPRKIALADKDTVNMGLVALANALDHAGANRKFMVLDMNQPGTSRATLMDDAQTGRSFTHLADMVALVRGGGSDVGLVIENWYNGDAASIPQIGPVFAPYYFGQRWGGEAFALGSTNPDNPVQPTLVYDHCLWDIEAAANDAGRGIFARARTKLAIMGPMPFNNAPVSPDPEWENFTGTGPRIVEPARAMVADFVQDARVQTFCVGYGPSTHLSDFGGGIHPLPDDPFGTAQFALSHAPAILNWIGIGVDEPRLDGVELSPDGAFADVVVDLPNGGTLTTPRLLEGLAGSATPAPHQLDVVGFEISRAGAARRPVFASGEAGYPAAHRGSVVISDSGSGTPRQGKVRITPEVPFETGDQISYLLGQATANLVKPRDVDAKLHLDMLVEHIPALHDAASAHPFRGVAVRPNAETPTLVRASTFQARAAHFDGVTNYASSSVNQPASARGLMSVWLRNRDIAWNNTTFTRICQFRMGSAIVMEVRLTSSGRMSFTLKQTGSGDDIFTPPTGTFTNDQWHHIAWSWDQPAARFQIYVDGVALDTSAYDWGDGVLEMAGQNLTRVGIGGSVGTSNQCIADLGHLWIDFNQSLDLSVPANLARFLSGNAPADPGAAGELVTGTAPQYYYDGAGASWANLGTAGNVPLNGALSAADSTPSL